MAERSTVSWVTIEGLRKTAPPAHHPGQQRPDEPDLRARVGRLENLLIDMYDLLQEHGIAFREREPSVLICHVAGCENEAVGGEIGEGGDLLLCADHLRGEVTGG